MSLGVREGQTGTSDDLPRVESGLSVPLPQPVVKVDLRLGVAHALEDLHGEFVKASKLLDQVHNGATRNVDQRIVLIATYSEAVERLIRSVSETPADREDGA